MTRHLLEIDDLTPDELATVLELCHEQSPPQVLAGRGAALLFEKPSLRTRHSTEMAVVQLGGHPITVRADEVSLDVRETVEDVAQTLAGYHATIGARGLRARQASNAWPAVVATSPCSTCCRTRATRCRR